MASAILTGCASQRQRSGGDTSSSKIAYRAPPHCVAALRDGKFVMAVTIVDFSQHSETNMDDAVRH